MIKYRSKQAAWAGLIIAMFALLIFATKPKADSPQPSSLEDTSSAQFIDYLMKCEVDSVFIDYKNNTNVTLKDGGLFTLAYSATFEPTMAQAKAECRTQYEFAD